MELVTKAAAQLNNQEMRVRNATLNTQRLEREDEAYKSYGVLKYARKISERMPGFHFPAHGRRGRRPDEAGQKVFPLQPDYRD